jgi:hypothetical protein
VALADRFTIASVLDQGSIEVVIGRKAGVLGIAAMMPGSSFPPDLGGKSSDASGGPQSNEPSTAYREGIRRQRDHLS